MLTWEARSFILGIPTLSKVPKTKCGYEERIRELDQGRGWKGGRAAYYVMVSWDARIARTAGLISPADQGSKPAVVRAFHSY